MSEIVNVFLLFVAIISAIIFALWAMRKVILWYFRIDEARENERKIIALLQHIASKD